MRWQEVSKREQIKCLNVLAPQSRDWVAIYDVFFSGVHFSNLHFVLTFDELVVGKEGKAKSSGLITRIGMSKMDKEEIKTIIEMIEELGGAMRLVLANQREQKSIGLGAHRFAYQPHKDNLFPKDFIDYLRSTQSLGQ